MGKLLFFNNIIFMQPPKERLIELRLKKFYLK
jgi:hypothetical protein